MSVLLVLILIIAGIYFYGRYRIRKFLAGFNMTQNSPFEHTAGRGQRKMNDDVIEGKFEELN